jgi:hypothetical protein
MSHHFDYPEDERLDLTDAFCFAGPSDSNGPRTVFGMNASPTTGTAWDPVGYYELKVDTNGDYVEDITWRFTFPVDSDGTQYVQVAQLTGANATNRDAPGTIITPPNAPVGEVLNLANGLMIYTGQRTDPFYNYIPLPVAIADALAAGTFPDLDALLPATDSFLDTSVRSIVLEAPVSVTGSGPLHFWATTAIYDTGHSTWLQLQRAATPNGTTFWDFTGGSADININATVPTQDLAGRPANPDTDPASGVWGQVRDQTAAVVKAGGTYNQGKNGRPTPEAYGAWVADTILPMVLTYIPGTNALWDPWNGADNGKALTEDVGDTMIRMVLNQDFVSGLTQPTPLLDYFPYVSPPPPAS